MSVLFFPSTFDLEHQRPVRWNVPLMSSSIIRGRTSGQLVIFTGWRLQHGICWLNTKFTGETSFLTLAALSRHSTRLWIHHLMSLESPQYVTISVLVCVLNFKYIHSCYYLKSNYVQIWLEMFDFHTDYKKCTNFIWWVENIFMLSAKCLISASVS